MTCSPQASPSDQPTAADLIIIGAGPAGAVAGTVAARRGLRTLIIEKAALPGHKACGGLLSRRAAELLLRLFDEELLRQVTRTSTTNCRFYFRGRLLTEVQGCDRIHLTRREEFDARLLREAQRHGCQLRRGRVLSVDPEAGLVRLDDGTQLRADLIIGADGLEGPCRRRLLAGAATRRLLSGTPPSLLSSTATRRERYRRNVGFGLVVRVPLATLRPAADRVCPDSANVYFGDPRWGYGWLFPCGDEANIGVWGLMSPGLDLRRSLLALLSATTTITTLDGLPLLGRQAPMGSFMTRPARGRLLLVGDAAGLAEPVTGEGLAAAIESGAMAAEAVAKALAAGRMDRPAANVAPAAGQADQAASHAAPAAGQADQAAAAYCAAIEELILPRVRQAAWARWLFYPRLCQPLAMRTLRRHPSVAAWYMQIVSGDLTYRDFFGRMWRALFRH